MLSGRAIDAVGLIKGMVVWSVLWFYNSRTSIVDLMAIDEVSVDVLICCQ